MDPRGLGGSRDDQRRHRAGRPNLSAFNCGSPCSVPATGFRPSTGSTTSSIERSECSTPPQSAQSGASVHRADQYRVGVQDQSQRSARLLRPGRQQHLGAARALLAVCVDDLQLQRTHHDVHGRAFLGEQQHRVRHTAGLFNIWAIQVPYNAAFDDPASPTFGQGGTYFRASPAAS